MMAAIDLSRYDPFISPNWRWERARTLLTKNRYASKTRDDEFVMIAKKFQAAYDKCKNDLDQEKLQRRFPGIWYAMKTYFADRGDVRWIIEARVLAGQSCKEIADKCNVCPETVAWYEKLFFDTRSKLKSPDYVINVVMRGATHYGLKARDYDLLWKLFGYFGGPFVLDAIFNASLTRTRPTSKDTVKAFFDEDSSGALKRVAAIASRTIDLNNPMNYQFILDTHTKLLQIEKEAEGNSQDLIVQNIGAMLGSFQFVAGAKAIKEQTSDEMSFFDDQAEELRADEMLQLALRPNKSEDLKRAISFQFPETETQQEVSQ